MMIDYIEIIQPRFQVPILPRPWHSNLKQITLKSGYEKHNSVQ